MPQELTVLFLMQGIDRMIEFSAPFLGIVGLLLSRENVLGRIIVGMLLGVGIPNLLGTVFSLPLGIR